MRSGPSCTATEMSTARTSSRTRWKRLRSRLHMLCSIVHKHRLDKQIYVYQYRAMR